MAKLSLLAFAPLALPAALLLMGTAPIPPAVLTTEGLGPAKIGMTEAQVRAAGVRWTEDPGADPACKSVEMKGRTGVYMMFEDGKLTRISLYEGATVRTDKGLGLGSTERQVKTAYPQGLKVQPHAYEDAPAHYLTWWAQPNRRGIKYSTDRKGVVNQIDAGSDSITLIEGCA